MSRIDLFADGLLTTSVPVGAEVMAEVSDEQMEPKLARLRAAAGLAAAHGPARLRARPTVRPPAQSSSQRRIAAVRRPHLRDRVHAGRAAGQP